MERRTKAFALPWAESNLTKFHWVRYAEHDTSRFASQKPLTGGVLHEFESNEALEFVSEQLHGASVVSKAATE